MEYYGVRTSEGLYHHGILGQKWGVMNGPPYPLGAGEHSPAERKHMKGGDTGPASLSKRKKGHVTSEGAKAKRKNISNLNGTDSKKGSNGKSPGKNNVDYKKLSSSLTRYYVSQGKSQKEAAEMARQNEIATKIAIGVAVGALAAGTAYAVYKTNHDPYKDFVIGAGKSLQRISQYDDPSVREQFYGAFDKVDKLHYEWRLPQFRRMQGLGDMYQHQMKVERDIKVAGIDSCRSIFNDLKSNDPDFRAALRNPLLGNMDDYVQFDQNMVVNGDDNFKAFMGGHNPFVRFQNELKNRGYGAMIDYNDAQGQGFGSDRPIIFFGQQTNINVENVKKLDDSDLAKAFGGYKIIEAGRQFAEQSKDFAPTVIVSTSGVAGINYVTAKVSDQKIISAYKKEHPNSNMSNQKILESYIKNHRSGKKK